MSKLEKWPSLDHIKREAESVGNTLVLALIEHVEELERELADERKQFEFDNAIIGKYEARFQCDGCGTKAEADTLSVLCAKCLKGHVQVAIDSATGACRELAATVEKAQFMFTQDPVYRGRVVVKAREVLKMLEER